MPKGLSKEDTSESTKDTKDTKDTKQSLRRMQELTWHCKGDIYRMSACGRAFFWINKNCSA